MNKVKTIVFVSNYLTQHQVPLSDALWAMTKGQYTFIATSPQEKIKQELGKNIIHRQYVLIYGEKEEKAKELIRNADVMISGSAPEWLVQERVKTGRLLLRYSERPLKKGFEIWRYPDRFLRWHWRNHFWKPIYMLCASGYTASDYRKFGLFKNKCYKWGYFPETRRYVDFTGLLDQKNVAEILWCGRFLDWKHPDDALAVASMLKSEGFSFRMKFIGGGELEKKLQDMAREYDLGDCVSFLGEMTPEQVRDHMDKAGIYLFTSDQQEGWGAVLNESMNSGCAVVASDAIGSVPYLLEDGKNGMVYTSGNVQMLYDRVRYLLEHSDEQKRLGSAAYRTIREVWNAETAAERLLILSEGLLNQQQRGFFATGPCSFAG